MKNKNNHMEITDKECKKCKGMIVTKTHKEINEKMLRGIQFFSQWDYCTVCHTIWYDPQYKVLVKDYLEAKKYENEIEIDEGNSLFFNL